MLWTLSGLLSDEGTIKNCAKWSDIENVKFPEVQFSKSGLFENMLSIKVWDRLVILVGSVMWGTKRLEVSVSKKSLVSEFVSELSRSMLKSPAR